MRSFTKSPHRRSRSPRRVESGVLEPLAPFVCHLRDNVSIEGSIEGRSLLHADGEPPGGLACGSFGLSRGSVLNPFEPQTAALSQGRRPAKGASCSRRQPSPDDRRCWRAVTCTRRVASPRSTLRWCAHSTVPPAPQNPPATFRLLTHLLPRGTPSVHQRRRNTQLSSAGSQRAAAVQLSFDTERHRYVLRRKAFPTLSSPFSWRQVVNAAVVDDPRASVVASPVVFDCRRLPSGFRMHGHLPSTHRKVRRFTTTHAPLLSILLASASGEPLCISLTLDCSLSFGTRTRRVWRNR